MTRSFAPQQPEIVFITAAFGEQYRLAVDVLIRSFTSFHEASSLIVYTDLNIQHPQTVRTSLSDCLVQMPKEYRETRQNVFKFELFRRTFAEHPGAMVVWIDADTAVLGPLTEPLIPGVVNVVPLERTGRWTIRLGNGLHATSDVCASGNYYCLPSPRFVEDLMHITRERLDWKDWTEIKSGDQVIINHLIRQGDVPVHWLDGTGNGHFSLGLVHRVREVEEWPNVEIGASDSGLHYRGERIVLFSHTKLWLDYSILSGFREYPAPIRAHLRSVYRWYEIPARTRLLGLIRWAIAVEVPRRAPRVLRSNSTLKRLKEIVAARLLGPR